MPMRRLTPEDWSPASTSISTFSRSSFEPRDERVQIPRTRERAALRPKPLNIAATKQNRPSPTELKAPPPSRKESSESQCENLRDPEVVDSAPSEPWPTHDFAPRNRHLHSPSIGSRNSTRQSEISLGILDYYLGAPTPSLHCQDPPPTPKVDPAIDKFDFGLPPTPTPSAAPQFQDSPPAKAGAERTEQLIPISPPSRPSASTNNSYRLFPVIKQVTPPPRQPTIISPLPLRDSEITPPSTSYRPRKESITSTSARKESISIRTPPSSSFSRRTKQQSCTSPDLFKSHWSNSTSQSQSRWSEDTITPPKYQQNTGTYPDCFFEDDDDEDMPLRRRIATWRTTGSGSGRSSYDSGRRRGGGFWRWVRCGCGGR